MYDKNRVERLYKKSRERAINQPESLFDCNFQSFMLNKYSNLELWERIARSMADAITEQPLYIDEDDRIIGRVYHNNCKKPEVRDHDLDNLTLADADLIFDGYSEFCRNQLAAFNCPGHIAWGWDTILREGTEGIKERCTLALSRNKDEKSVQFLSGVLIMVDALEKWNGKHIAELERLGMTEQAEICRRVPRHPARSFREAVQSFFMQYIVVMRENAFGGNSPGRLDYYLWPYLEADLKVGKCTLDDAREIIDELFLRIDERIHKSDGWVEALAIGGSLPNGASAINPLTYIMIEENMKFDITHPAVYVRLPKDPPADFVDLCVRYIKDGGNRAQILSDESIVRALVRNGVPYNDAVDYYCGGCMEIGVQGKTADFLWVGHQNLPKFVELSATGGYCLITGKMQSHYNAKGLSAYSDFESFYADFIEEYRRITNAMFMWQDKMGEHAEKVRPSYLISSMIADCIHKGRNMHGGGARYYDYGVSVIGFANAADSLFAIKKAVFDEKFCTADELVAAMKANFAGYEELRARLMKLPKYGQENAEADALTSRLISDVSEIFRNYVNRFGGNGKLVILTFTLAPVCGAKLGASADGRLSGKVVAQGVTPQGSAMTCGITTAINSCTSMPFEVFAGGASTMWDLDEAFASEEIIKALLLSFFEGGGQIFQGNTTNVADLIKAKEHPEEFYNLIVRVGGYSARFVSLNTDLQDEIIARIRHTR